jgi:osmotically-inducible protein OsmY
MGFEPPQVTVARNTDVGARGKEQVMNDDVLLRQNVEDELQWRPQINAAHVGVSAEDGVVTLTGDVGSCAEKRAVEEAARSVIGVRGIVEKLQVRPAGAEGGSDDEIAKRALNALAWNALVPADSVSVSVENGFVVLTGSVCWQYQRNAAEDAVHYLAGVIGVRNEVGLKAQPQPEDIGGRIEAALRRSAAIDAEGIRVAITEGVVTLEGTVGSWSERARVESAVWSAPGVRVVCDNLRIAG